MKPLASYRFQPLETLIRHKLEQTQFVLPATIRCVIKQQVLFIVLDYAAINTVDSQIGHKAIHQALSQCSQKYPDILLKSNFQGSVRCYWRQQGQRQPWASYCFDYKPLDSPSVTAKNQSSISQMHSPCSPHSSHTGTTSKNTKDLTEQTNYIPSLHQGSSPAAPSPQSSLKHQDKSQLPSWLVRSLSVVRQGLNRSTLTASLLPSSSISSKTVAIIPPKPSVVAFLWTMLKTQNRRWGLGLSVFMALGAIGVGSYAWSRPCVSNSCTILDQAQAINSSLAFDANASVEEVAQTYTALLNINYQLSQIPFWSPHYDEVKGLLMTYETHTHLVSQVLGAQEHAQVAIDSSQSPPYPLHDWQETQGKWQEAIQTLEPVSENTIVAPLAQTHLQEYSTKLQSIEQKMQQEQAALNKVKSARKFAQMAEMNNSSTVSLEQLKQVEAYWQNALDHLTNVPAESMAYAEAEHLQAIYYPQLLDVRDRLAIETLAEEAYNQAIIFAEQSTAFEQEEQWSLAVQRWQQALEHIEQVPENTTYYEQVFPLVTSYTAALSNAQTHLKKAVALQKAQAKLTQRCSTMSDICGSVTVDHDLHVWLTPHSYDADHQQLQPTINHGLKSGTEVAGESLIPSLGNQDINIWLGEISAIGKTMQVTINVYNPDGTVLGTYSPQSASFVRTATTVEAELDTTVASVTPEAS